MECKTDSVHLEIGIDKTKIDNDGTVMENTNIEKTSDLNVSNYDFNSTCLKEMADTSCQSNEHESTVKSGDTANNVCDMAEVHMNIKRELTDNLTNVECNDLLDNSSKFVGTDCYSNELESTVKTEDTANSFGDMADVDMDIKEELADVLTNVERNDLLDVNLKLEVPSESVENTDDKLLQLNEGQQCVDEENPSSCNEHNSTQNSSDDCKRRCRARNNVVKTYESDTGEKVHDCKFCNKSFSQINNLITHKRIHSGEKPFSCKTCNLSFTQSCNLEKHMRIHSSERPYRCQTCDKSFTQSSNLVKHEQIHSGDKPFNCNICNKSFTQSSNLVKHIRVHSGEKPFQCRVCDKSFTQSSNLVKHERIHSNERLYTCAVCNKSFTQSSNLVKHMQIHSGEKPHQCKICNKSFTQSSNLVKHIRIHSGEKPFGCDICNKSFTQSSNLVKHMQIHLTMDGIMNCKE